jgi:hypothetical protein
MKNLILIIFTTALMFTVSCSEKVNISTPEPAASDTNIVSNGFDFYLNYTVNGSTVQMKNNVDHVANGVNREDVSPCAFGNNVKFTSYFAYASDSTRKDWLAFGLSNCILDGGNGVNDSTFKVFTYPIEIYQQGAAIGFILYNDPNNVLWSSSLSPNGLDAQKPYSISISEVAKNFDGFSALKVKGEFSGWVYNLNGDSLLISDASFYSRARAF